MPHPFPALPIDWSGASLVQRIKDQRRRRRANRDLAEAISSGFSDDQKELNIALALGAGADPDHLTGGNTPLRALEWAVARRRFNLATTLLDAGAGLSASVPHRPMHSVFDLLYQTPVRMNLFAATVVALGDALKVGATLTARGVSPEPVLRALDAFLDRGANPWTVGEGDDPQGRLTTPLHLLVIQHNPLRDVPPSLLRTLDPTRTDVHGDTAAHVLVRHGNAHYPPGEQNKDLCTGLIALAQAGARLDAARNHDGNTPLDLLTQSLDPYVPAEVLLALYEAVPTLRWDGTSPSDGRSPLDRLRERFARLDPMFDGIRRPEIHRLQAMVRVEEVRALHRTAQDADPAIDLDGPAAMRPRARL